MKYGSVLSICVHLFKTKGLLIYAYNDRLAYKVEIRYYNRCSTLVKRIVKEQYIEKRMIANDDNKTNFFSILSN